MDVSLEDSPVSHRTSQGCLLILKAGKPTAAQVEHVDSTQNGSIVFKLKISLFSPPNYVTLTQEKTYFAAVSWFSGCILAI